MLLKMAEWTGLFMKVHPASHITTFLARTNYCANLPAMEQVLNLNTTNNEKNFALTKETYSVKCIDIININRNHIIKKGSAL